MREVIFDTNVLVAGLRSKRGASYQLIRLFTGGRFRLNVSVALAFEYEDVLKRPGLLTGITPQKIDIFLDLWFANNTSETKPCQFSFLAARLKVCNAEWTAGNNVTWPFLCRV